MRTPRTAYHVSPAMASSETAMPYIGHYIGSFYQPNLYSAIPLHKSFPIHEPSPEVCTDAPVEELEDDLRCAVTRPSTQDLFPKYSSLSMALGKYMCPPACYLPPVHPKIPEPLPGHIRVLQSCNINSDDFILFTERGNRGVTLDSIRVQDQNLDQADMPVPWSDVYIMHVSWEGYTSSRVRLTVEQGQIRLTVQQLGKAISHSLADYMTANNINVTLDQLCLVAFGRGDCEDDWVVIVDKISWKEVYN